MIFTAIMPAPQSRQTWFRMKALDDEERRTRS